MSHQDSSVKSIIYAFSANLGIAIIKTIAAVITSSGAMMAEAIHSFADCGNQGLLFVGLRVSKKGPNAKYPLGRGKEIFFWSFVVALILFSMGGLFSVYEGIHKMYNPEPLTTPLVAIIVLTLSVVLESASLYGCLTEIKKVKRGKSLWKWFRSSRQSELVVVLGEDIAALLGLSFALVFILMAMISGNPIYDALGSIGIGVLLVIISIFLAIKIKGLLIGQSVDDEVQEEIRNFIEKQEEVNRILSMITLQLGSQIMLAVKVKMSDTQTTNELITNINKCEKAIKKHFTSIQWIFFEPDFED